MTCIQRPEMWVISSSLRTFDPHEQAVKTHHRRRHQKYYHNFPDRKDFGGGARPEQAAEEGRE